MNDYLEPRPVCSIGGCTTEESDTDWLSLDHASNTYNNAGHVNSNGSIPDCSSKPENLIQANNQISEFEMDYRSTSDIVNSSTEVNPSCSNDTTDLNFGGNLPLQETENDYEILPISHQYCNSKVKHVKITLQQFMQSINNKFKIILVVVCVLFLLLLGISIGLAIGSRVFKDNHHEDLAPNGSLSSEAKTTSLVHTTQQQTDVLPGTITTGPPEKHNMLETTTENKFSDIETNATKRSFVGFTAFAQTDIKYSINETIHFTGTIFNKNFDNKEDKSSYNEHTGNFQCPTTGTYFVYLGVKKTNQNLQLSVTLDYSRVILSLHSNRSINSYGSIANSALVLCYEGSNISLAATGVGEVFGTSADPHSTFSVFLINGIAGTDEVYAFSSSLLHSQPYKSGETITFSNILYHQGDYYDNQMFRFLCPFPGMYYVSLSAQRYGYYDLSLAVTKETRPIFDIVQNFHLNEYTVSTNNVLIRCDTNESIKVLASGNGYVYGTTLGTESIFSIFNVHRDGMNEDDPNDFIGFSMYKKAKQDYTTNDVILFDGVVANEKGHYNMELNAFVCPVTAVYFISINARKFSDLTLSIYVDHLTRELLVLSDNRRDNGWHVISNSVVFSCSKGDVIQVKALDSGSVYGHHSMTITTYSLFILHQDQ